jgi:hypothetical protein
MLPLLIDENFNQRILRGLMRAVPGLDFVLIQDVGLRGCADPVVLAWAAEQKRVLVTHDLKTIPKHAYERIHDQLPMPGVISLPDSMTIRQSVEELKLLVQCINLTELENLVFYLPLR